MADIVLRPLRLEDAPRVCLWMNDKDTVRYLGGGFENPVSLEDAKERIALQLDGEFTGERFAVSFADTGEYLGECSLLLPDGRAKKAELALVLLPGARGRGYALQALKLLLDYAFLQKGYQRLYLKCAFKNQRAVHLYERAGFVKEGVLRRHLYTDEGPDDVILYGMLREEYLARREQ